jgi:hypothetical protein
LKIEPIENEKQSIYLSLQIDVDPTKTPQNTRKKWLNILCKFLPRQEELNIQLHKICKEPALKYKTILLASCNSVKISKQCNKVSRSST